MFDFWKDELSEQEEEELLDKAASEIRKRKLEAPAILMLELHKPVAYVGSHAAIAFSPFMVHAAKRSSARSIHGSRPSMPGG